jgi:hypothetical protein
MLGNSVSLHRVNLSLQKSLDLANLYLRNAWDSTDAEITLVLCHDTKDALSQAKKVARRTGDRSMDALIATTHIDLGGLLERQGHRDEAMHSARRPESGGKKNVTRTRRRQFDRQMTRLNLSVILSSIESTLSLSNRPHLDSSTHSEACSWSISLLPLRINASKKVL